jgi:hypothetical protein
MTFLCLSRVLINTAHIVAILTEGKDYTVQTSRTYASQYAGPAAGNLSYSYPEHFTIPKESDDGAIIRSWLACQSFQPWPNAKEKKQHERKQKRKDAKAEEPKPKADSEEVDALLHEASTKHEEAPPRHASAALRRLNEHLRNSPGGSPSLSRSASPFQGRKAPTDAAERWKVTVSST